MSTVVDEIADAVVEDLRQRAKTQGLATLNAYNVNGAAGELAGHTVGGFTMTSTAEGMATVFDTSTGEPRTFPLDFLGKTLRKMRGGKKAFVPADPATGRPMSPVPEYQVGTLKCFLHPDHPGREELRTMGIGDDIICGDNTTAPAGSFRTEFDLRAHEQKRHPRSWAIRQEYREKLEKEAAREEQRRHTEAILALAKGGGGVAPARMMFVCEAEGCDRFFDSAQGLSIHTSKEHRG